MVKRKISHLDLKIKLTKECLENGGIKGIPSVGLLEDLIKVKTGPDGKADPDSITPRVNAYMLALLHSHSTPPYFHPEYISEYKSTLQKANSFNQENIDTPEQFDEIYAEYKEKENTLFRGQREAKWRLYGRLQRQWIVDGLFKSKNPYSTFLSGMIKRGRDKYEPEIQKILNENHLDTMNDVSVLGYLQHHGCPTPLLDWTYRIQNALYFALDGLTPRTTTIEIDDYCSVYFIEEAHFGSTNMRNIIDQAINRSQEDVLDQMIRMVAGDDEAKIIAMKKHFKGRNAIDRSRIKGSGMISHATKIENLINLPISYFSDRDSKADIMFSLNNSKNILNQKGVFTWNADSSKPLEIMGDEMYQESIKEKGEEYNPVDYRFCSCFNINKKLEPHIRKKLEEDGITKEFIYPTPDIDTWGIYEECKTNDIT